MEVPRVWKESISKQIDTKIIIQELIGQIVKDFGMFGEAIHFTENTEESYFILSGQLESFLHKTYAHQTEKLYPILYRIDILEKDIKKAINNPHSGEFMKDITELIILKELQKVIIRRYYKSKT